VSNFFLSNPWLVPFLPLLGGAIAAVGAKQLKQHAHLPVAVGIALAFLVSLFLISAASPTAKVVYPDWLHVSSSFQVPLEFQLDGLSTMMASMVTFVATLIAIFAAGYMAGDPGYPRFFAVMGLFVASMTGLVLSGNYLLTYACWEGVGVCSYLLVGFWHSKPAAAAAAKKAFLVNRLGDIGFAIALFWLWSISRHHDLGYQSVLSVENFNFLHHSDRLGIALLLFWAATAKSAQIPLYVWLPDAMEGPTPVSALIHAATMVTAGVYLIARSTPLFVTVPEVQALIAVVGCATALLSASIAVTQTDLKRVMAYSTVSQLGYMFMALGAGVGNIAQIALVAAMFHLFTHAFFKALLFLASGSVMHSMGGVIDMRRFSGLRHKMPITCWTFAAGALALSGIFPLAGFWSKDEILSSLRSASAHGDVDLWKAIYAIVYWVAILTAFMTAFYTGRAFFKTFWGPEKLPSPDDPEATADDHGHGSSHADPGHGHDPGDSHSHEAHLGHESPPIMSYPLLVLAACAVLVGLVFGPTHLFEHHLHKTYGIAQHGENEAPVPASATGVKPRSEAGAGHAKSAGESKTTPGGSKTAAATHEDEPADAATSGPTPAYLPPIVEAHGPDWLTPVVGTLAGFGGLILSYLLYGVPSPIPAQLATRFRRLYTASYNKFYVDEFYDAVIIGPTRFVAAMCAFLDTYLVDGVLVRGTAWLPRLFARYGLARFQNGLIQSYVATTALGVAILFLILLFFHV
jgi:NADH-quinone oxidoreductase subunit L